MLAEIELSSRGMALILTDSITHSYLETMSLLTCAVPARSICRYSLPRASFTHSKNQDASCV
eukprot:5540508-Amphidinium_carterae.1